MKIKEDIQKVEDRTSIENFKRGFNEEKIFGPICIFLLTFFILLYIFQYIELKVLISSFVLIIFIFFIYFPYHKKPIIIFFIFGIGAPLAILGIWSMLTKQVTFGNIKYLALLWWLFLIGAAVIRHFALKKHKIEEIDITLGYFKKKFGRWIVPVLNIISFLVFPLFAGSFYLFGYQHYYLWIPIFLFWAVSGIRLIKYKI